MSRLRGMNIRIVMWCCCLAFVGGNELLADEVPPALPETKILRGKQDCFRISQVRDFEYLDDRNLIVTAAGRRTYHIELFAGCLNLENAFGIEFRGHAGRVCGTAGDAVAVRDMLGREDEFDQRCMVRRVRLLDEEGLYELSIVAEKVPPPPPLPKAEIELPPEEADSLPAIENPENDNNNW
jgi:hypothetical protein